MEYAVWGVGVGCCASWAMAHLVLRCCGAWLDLDMENVGEKSRSLGAGVDADCDVCSRPMHPAAAAIITLCAAAVPSTVAKPVQYTCLLHEKHINTAQNRAAYQLFSDQSSPFCPLLRFLLLPSKRPMFSFVSRLRRA